MPTLTPIEGNPFTDSLQGDVGAAMAKQQGDEAQRRGVVGQYLAHYTLPHDVMQGVQTETPGVLTEEDAFRFNQLQDRALQFGPHQALSMIGGGLPAAGRGAQRFSSGQGGPSREDIKTYRGIGQLARHADWSKFERGAKPSTNIEDARQDPLLPYDSRGLI